MSYPLKEETGNAYGKLTVVSRYWSNNVEGKARWICKCSCGGTKIAIGAQLRKGATTHCGCISKKVRLNDR